MVETTTNTTDTTSDTGTSGIMDKVVSFVQTPIGMGIVIGIGLVAALIYVF